MRVRDLIKKLKAMPQNLEVGTSAHDNYEWEVQSWVCDVTHITKPDYDNKSRELLKSDRDCLESMPKEWVVLSG